jgi:hypothetical protein
LKIQNSENINMKNSFALIKIFHLSFLFPLLFSCHDPENYNFPIRENLKGKNIGPTDYFMKPTRCIWDGNLLLVLDENKSDIFHALNDQFELVGSWGKIGNGPHELSTFPLLSNQNFSRYESICFYESNKNQIGFLSYTNCDSFEFNNLSYQKIPGDIYYAQNIQRLSLKKFAVTCCPFKGKLGIFNLSDTSSIFTPFIPEYEYIKNQRNNFEYYIGDIVFQPDLDKLAYANRNFMQIEIYASNGKLLKEIKPGKNVTFDSTIKNRYYYYNAICATKEFIYASYLGVERKYLQLKNLGLLRTKIQVFTWDGLPVAELSTGKLTGYFTVDVSNKFLICMDETNYNQPLIYFDLPKLTVH